MKVIARSKKFLYFNNQGYLVSCMLNHSEGEIANKFYSLPFFNNEDEVETYFKSLNLPSGDWDDEG
jgi:hypothetical protein